MRNICECKEEKTECKIGFQQSTIMEILAEMNRLRLENEQLRNDNNELHNRLNINNQYDTVVDGNEDLSYVDEYAKGFEMAEELGYKIV